MREGTNDAGGRTHAYGQRREKAGAPQWSDGRALSAIAWNRADNAVNQRHPRTFAIRFNRMRWSLNGRTFEMNNVAGDETVRLGDLEVWEFVNESSHMTMPHPIHIHNVQFQVIERRLLPQFTDLYRTVADGYIDSGWKDTVLLIPGERAKALIRFEDYEGLYLYHCHNLEHEDMGMMRNYRIKA
ncbi:MAG: multicopper oxidase domain-containing protein [Anaerolineae bacterium]|nr:multicopper oxidase domain-containing protein [Anaerolineae bacterium]